MSSPSPRSSLPLRGLLVLALGAVGGVIYWNRDPNAATQTGKPLAAVPTAGPTQTHPDEPPATAPGVIEFPRDMWDSAGLKVAAVEKSALAEAIQLTGKVTLNEDKLAHVFPLVEGRVDEVKVRFGQRVKKDELLVVVQSKEVGQGMLRLYQDRQNLTFAETKAQWTREVGKNALDLIEMMRAKASIDEIEKAFKDRTIGDYREKLMTAYVNHQKAEANKQRLSPLTESGAVPARQILEAESDLNAARATLQSLLEQITQDSAQSLRLSAQDVMELKTAISVSETNLQILGFEPGDLAQIDPAQQGEKLSHYPVTAPFDGTVISKDVVLLERVGPERQILTIADLSSVWVSADIYESHLPLLAQLSDQTIQLRCEAWPGKQFEARIFYTGDVVQESTRTIALRAVASNDEGLLKPGMFVTVELPSLNTGEVLQVPGTAIQNHEGKAFVFLQTAEESFERREVTVGRRNDQVVEVLTGLKANDRVVVDGGFALKSRMLSELLEE